MTLPLPTGGGSRVHGVGQSVADTCSVSENDHDYRESRDLGATLAHELRTPLNAILAWTRVLGPDVDRADLQRGLDVIARNAHRQARLLDDLESGAVVGVDGVDDALDVPAEDCPDLSGCVVLVIDDDDSARMATSGMVTAAGAVCEAVASASDALVRLRRRPVDLIVSDLSMPDMDGFELISAVRQESSTRVRTTPAIALSAMASSRVRQRAYRAGFQVNLIKPVSGVELCLAMASLLNLMRR
jgi:CheY-like chemotaxis protein